MPGNSIPPFTFDPVVVDQLACPACLGGLRLDEGKLVCALCGRTYPIVDGIPVLIAERAELRAIPDGPLD
jgi:uncharacterized protein YbaR (Trm112 family)